MKKDNNDVIKTRIRSASKTIRATLLEFEQNFDKMNLNSDTREINKTILQFVKEDLDELISNYKTLCNLLKK
jgi:CRISPR/Cas system Type II protein with McrA/HNH and RuvC-like nuclease domain